MGTFVAPIDQGVREEEVVLEHENIVENTNEEMPEREDVIDNTSEGLLEPKLDMEFASIDEIYEYWVKYGNKKGFPVKKRSTTNGEDGKPKYVAFYCSRSGKPKQSSKNTFEMRPSTKTQCNAKIRATHGPDGKWRMSSFFLEHNHLLSPGKSRYFKRNRVIRPYVKRRLELNDRAGIRPNKNYAAAVVEAGGPDNVSFLEKDCRNHLQSLKLKEGDAVAVQKYFMQMQADNGNFYSLMDLDDDSRIKNIFWADARSRSSYEEFGDVITFDTTYLTNKYDMPFAPFVGVNHHGQSILLGCALISKEDTATFTWVFKTWLKCMGGRAPAAIITDQDRAMQNAIEIVFPNIRHRWCLWHILKKLPVKLGSHPHYKSIKFLMKQAIYQSLEIREFETSWNAFIKKYELEKNEWLTSLYEERHRWVPIFVKDIFWAGMSTTQRSESMNAFFDGYVISTTALKKFLEQYENALRSKVEKENLEDYNSFNSQLPCITHYRMEKQFQAVYTTSKFKEFQVELTGKLYCSISSEKNDCGTKEYQVVEDMVIGENSREVTFVTRFEPNEVDIKCNCRLFQFRGIICRHAIVVLMHNKIQEVPEKYILRRWRKDVRRCHSKVKIAYSNWVQNPENERFDRMCNDFYLVADLATGNEKKTQLVMDWIRRLNEEMVKQDEDCEPNQPTSLPVIPASIDVDPICTESVVIHSPSAVPKRGRARTIRKKSIEEVVSKKKDKVMNPKGTGSAMAKEPPPPTAPKRSRPPKKNIGEVTGNKTKRGKKASNAKCANVTGLEKELNDVSTTTDRGGTQEIITECIPPRENDPTVGSSFGNPHQDHHYLSQDGNYEPGSFLRQLLDPSDDENHQ